MDKIGLSYEEIDKILIKSLELTKPVDVDAMRDVIATAMVKNNEELLKDIKQLITK